MVQRALLKLQTEVVAQVRVQHFTCNNRAKRRLVDTRWCFFSRSCERERQNCMFTPLGHNKCKDVSTLVVRVLWCDGVRCSMSDSPLEETVYVDRSPQWNMRRTTKVQKTAHKSDFCKVMEAYRILQYMQNSANVCALWVPLVLSMEWDGDQTFHFKSTRLLQPFMTSLTSIHRLHSAPTHQCSPQPMLTMHTVCAAYITRVVVFFFPRQEL